MFERKNLGQQFKAQDPSQYARRIASKDVYVPKDLRRESTVSSNSSALAKQGDGKERK